MHSLRPTRRLASITALGGVLAICALAISAAPLSADEWLHDVASLQPAPALPSPEFESRPNPPAEEIFSDSFSEDQNPWLPGPPIVSTDAEELPVGYHEEVLLDEPAPTFSSGHWLFSGQWYAQAEAVTLLKTKLIDRQLTAQTAVPPAIATPVLVLTTRTDSPTYQPGIRLAIGKILGRDAWNRDHMLEYQFFGLFEWETQARAVRTDDTRQLQTLLGPNAGDVAALHGNTSQQYIERSSLDSYAFNYRIRTRSTRDRMVLQHDGNWIHHSTPSRIWSCYAGVVRVAIDEEFDLLGAGPEQTAGRYIVNTNNDLVGVHFGGEYLEQHTFWQWGLRGRVGGLASMAQRRVFFDSTIDPLGVDPPTNTRRGDFREKNNAAFLIEGGMFTTWQMSPNMTLRVGYDLLYITGLAQASGNLSLPVANFSPLQIDGDAIYHGGSVGFNVVW